MSNINTQLKDIQGKQKNMHNILNDIGCNLEKLQLKEDSTLKDLLEKEEDLVATKFHSNQHNEAIGSIYRLMKYLTLNQKQEISKS